MPPGGLGSKRLGLIHKLLKYCHSARLEQHTLASLQVFFVFIVCFVTDGGVEGLLTSTSGKITLRKMLNYFTEANEASSLCVPGDPLMNYNTPPAMGLHSRVWLFVLGPLATSYRRK